MTVRVAARPVPAVDPLTLAVDDRLRSDDADRACLAAAIAGSAFGVLAGPAPSLGLLALALAPVPVDNLVTAGAQRRWRPGRSSG